MTILKNMLPTDLATTVKSEQAKGNLLTFDALRTYVMGQSRIAFGLEQCSAPETQLNNVTQGAASQPPDSQNPSYMDEQCEQWVIAEEGWQYHTEIPHDQQGSNAVLAIVGKGKGGVKKERYVSPVEAHVRQIAPTPHPGGGNWKPSTHLQNWTWKKQYWWAYRDAPKSESKGARSGKGKW